MLTNVFSVGHELGIDFSLLFGLLGGLHIIA